MKSRPPASRSCAGNRGLRRAKQPISGIQNALHRRSVNGSRLQHQTWRPRGAHWRGTVGPNSASTGIQWRLRDGRCRNRFRRKAALRDPTGKLEQIVKRVAPGAFLRDRPSTRPAAATARPRPQKTQAANSCVDCRRRMNDGADAPLREAAQRDAAINLATHPRFERRSR